MPRRIMISGGGTGGHIFPAIAIANTIKAHAPETEFLFVGAIGKMEMEKVPQAGYRIEGLRISGIQRSLSLSNLIFPFRLIGSLIKARALIRTFRPDVVVGVGGFASGPVLRMATWMKIPTLIQEQNSFAGITNRWVSKSVSRVCVAYDNMEKFFPKDRIVKTGNPVRKEMVDIVGKREKGLQHFGLSPELPVLLVIGGSLGARSINMALKDRIGELMSAGMQVLWQTGKNFFEEVGALRKLHEGKPLVITEFIYEMDLAYAVADLVVSRAGAIAVSELSLVGKPTILVPFPHAAEDHQTKNALALVKRQGAIHIADKDASSALIPAILTLLADAAQRDMLSRSILQFGAPNAAEDIAREVLKLADK